MGPKESRKIPAKFPSPNKKITDELLQERREKVSECNKWRRLAGPSSSAVSTLPAACLVKVARRKRFSGKLQAMFLLTWDIVGLL